MLTTVEMAFCDTWEQFYLPDLMLNEDLELFQTGSLAIADHTDLPGVLHYFKYVKVGGGSSTRLLRKRLPR